ncbi:hypothetical protein GCM10020256_45060 [Streptomyces thermocoprophilus]
MDVVHRVEAPPRQEGEIAAVTGEDGILVLEAAVGDVDDPLVPDPGEFDLSQGAADAGMRPGQPGAVRREREVAHGPVGGAQQFGDLAVGALGDVEEEQPPVVRGDREALTGRVGHHLQHPAQLTGGQPAGARSPVARGR